MGFLDNSGDIILDAVLTDAGRKRLAEGNGSFKIAKYAFGDDEIDYSNYDATNSSGSAYYDLQILQTPVLEAFTNNTATMQSKLMTLTNNNILYLPVVVLNNKDTTCALNDEVGSGSVTVAVDQTTAKTFQDSGGANGNGLGFYINGTNPGDANSRNIRCDQGLNTKEISNTYKIDAELAEHQYIVEIDNRFGSIVTGGGDIAGQAKGPPGQSVQGFSFIDDDNIASYYLSTTDYVGTTPPATSNAADPTDVINLAIAGPRGTNLIFRIQASTNLRTSEYLFNQLGGTFNTSGILPTATFKFIDSVVRVTGATTGYKLDIPVRFVKQTS